METRRYDIDWIRVLAVLVLFPFHTAQIFVPWDWHLKNEELSVAVAVFAHFVHQWHMPIFFLISGAASWYALRSKTGGRYLRDRVTRLFVPLVFGMLIVCPPQLYFERVQEGVFSGGYFSFFPLHSFEGGPYPEGNVSWQHLWFLAYLFLYSFAALPVFIWLKSESGQARIRRLAEFCEKRGVVFLLFIPLAIVRVTLEPFWPQTHDLISDWMLHAYYMVVFIYGFILMADVRFTDIINRHGPIALAVGAVLMSAYLVVRFTIGVGGWDNPGWWVFITVVRSINTWMWLVAILWLGNRFLNRPGPVLKYSNEAALPVYVLHQTVIVVIGFYVVQAAWSIGWKFTVVMTTSFIATMLIYELLVRRWNPVRVLFGMRWKK
jgi:fucose 4-O-acetylase-like acetyltransferase